MFAKEPSNVGSLSDFQSLVAASSLMFDLRAKAAIEFLQSFDSGIPWPSKLTPTMKQLRRILG